MSEQEYSNTVTLLLELGSALVFITGMTLVVLVAAGGFRKKS